MNKLKQLDYELIMLDLAIPLISICIVELIIMIF